MRLVIKYLKVLINFAFAAFIMLFVYFLVPGIKDLNTLRENADRQNTEKEHSYEAAADVREPVDSAIDQENMESAADEQEDAPAEDMHGGNEPSRYFITSEDIASIGSLSLNDKLTGMAVLSKLEKEDIERLYRLAAEGVTEDELHEMRQILEKKLSRDDIGVLLDILNRNKKAQAGTQPAR